MPPILRRKKGEQGKTKPNRTLHRIVQRIRSNLATPERRKPIAPQRK